MEIKKAITVNPLFPDTRGDQEKVSGFRGVQIIEYRKILKNSNFMQILLKITLSTHTTSPGSKWGSKLKENPHTTQTYLIFGLSRIVFKIFEMV